MLGRLRTKQKLGELGITQDTDCLLCGCCTETIPHLFFNCDYSKQCLQEIKTWLQWRCQGLSMDAILKWIRKAKISAVKRKIFQLVTAAMVYNIWRVRNEVLWSFKLWMVSNTVQRIKQDIRLRLRMYMPKKATVNEKEWVECICLK